MQSTVTHFFMSFFLTTIIILCLTNTNFPFHSTATTATTTTTTTTISVVNSIPLEQHFVLQRTGKINFKYQNISLDDLPKTSFKSSIRYVVSTFPLVTTILGRNVTCEPLPSTNHEVYFEPTWACDNLKVDGFRLPYTNTVGQVHRLVKLPNDKETCGSFYRQHNMLDFCQAMLSTMGLKHISVPYVIVNKISCETVAKGLLFVKSTLGDGHYWYEHKTSTGVSLSIRCGLALNLA